jgi:hypothetical protein
MHNVRLTCDKKIDRTICNNILNIFDFDILCIIIDFYAYILRINNKMIELLPKTKNIFLKYLYLDKNKLNILLEILMKDKYQINSMYSYVINNIIDKFCKTVN